MPPPAKQSRDGGEREAARKGSAGAERARDLVSRFDVADRNLDDPVPVHRVALLDEGAVARSLHFDVVHVHEPFVPSVSMLALMSAECPVVSTFHTAMDRSRAFEVFTPVLRPVLEKIQARIAVSQEARRTAVQYLGGDAFVIPNGVYTRQFVEGAGRALHGNA